MNNKMNKVFVPLLALLMALPWQFLLAQTHTLNLKDADIEVLVATVAEITGRSFIIDPRVTGKVTVISSASMDKDQIYQVFISILNVHGLAAIPGDGVVKIVPGVQALQSYGGSEHASGEDIVTRLIAVTHVKASELVPLLRPLMPSTAQIIAHDSSNTLLIADRAANVDRLQRVIRRIDRAVDEDVEVIRLEHANARELAATLNRLYPANQAHSAIADERTNTLLLGGDPSRRLKLRSLISHLDTPLESGGTTQVVYLNYARATELVPILEQVLNASLGEAAERTSVAAIQAHEETNALIITAPPAVFRSLQPVIRQLDIRRQQVLVEAIIAEVSMKTLREVGVQWQFFNNLGDPGGGAFGGTNFNSGGNNIINLANGFGSDTPVSPGTGLNIGYVSGTTSILGTEFLDIGLLIRALEADSDTNILSTPSIVTLDNSEAEIYIGQEVPFVTGQFTNTGLANLEGTVNPFQTISRNEVGIRLTVTPHINEGDAVVLDISQEVSAIAPITGAVDLITNKRTLKTTVMVPDNTILVLGGLISDDLRETEESVPFLGRIPWLGRLFRYNSTELVKRSLMIFIRPRIMTDNAAMQGISGGKYNYLRARQLEYREQARGLTPTDQMPLLPELYDYLQTPPPRAPAGSEN